MSISREEMEQIAREVLGPTMRDEHDDPEKNAARDRDLAWLAELEAKGRPEATEDQKKIWQEWGESELRRIEREKGTSSE